MMKLSQLFIQFLIFSLIFNPLASAIIVDTNVFTPTEFTTMKIVAASPAVLENKILVAGETSTMTTSLNNGKISISDSVHTFREVSMDYQMLLDELDGFNGEKIALTHINDAGEIDYRRVVSVSPDVNGYVSVIMEFSTTIVSGFTGYTTTTLTGLSGNQSISVPDGSSYDLNITNNQYGVWTINGTVFSKRLLWTLNTTSENLTDIQVGRVTPYDSDMQVDMDDRKLTYYENDTLISFWDENVINSVNATGYVKVPKTSTTEQQQYWLYYGNSSANSVSNGNNTFIQYTGSNTVDDSGDFTNNNIITYSNVIYETSYKRVSSDSNLLIGLSNVNGNTDDSIVLQAYTGGTHHKISTYNEGVVTHYDQTAGNLPDSVFTQIKLELQSTTFSGYLDGVLIGSGGRTITANENMSLFAKEFQAGATGTQEWSFARKYTATEPTWASDGDEHTGVGNGTVNITASITGDSNEQVYNTSQSREFTLTPTGATNSVLINTTSIDYDVTVTTYWTEDTIKISEVLSNGLANITVQYTPSDNITAGVINATYNTINFVAHDYTGDLSVSVDGVNYSSNGTRLLNDVNTTIVNFDTSTHYINFSVPYNPPLDLYAPNDTATLSYAYPPLTHDVVLTWEQSTGTYKYTVTDYDTGATISSSTVSSNTTTVPLSSGQYKWYVNGYDDIFDEYGLSSAIRSFTIEDTFSYPNDTVVHGVVYEYILDVQTPLDTALVNIWNSTWSGSSMTGSNGYFVFHGVHNSTYSMRATKPGYVDGNIELVTPTFNTTLTRDILLQSYTGAGREYVTHYVLFTVKTLWGTLYSGVDVNVYLGDAVIALYTGTTGTDGSIGFELVESNEYRLTFIDASQGINEEIIIYPVKSEYPVYIYDTLAPDDEDIESEEVTVSVTTAEINDTHAYINVTYTDAMSETTDLNIYINQSDESDPFNQTTITFANLGATSSVIHSFIIDDYPGQAYFINVDATHTTFGDIQRTYSVRFDGMLEDYGFSKIWVWIGVGGMMFVAGMFKASKAEQGALVVCAVGWVFMGMGFFDSLGSQAVTSMAAGLGLATVLAIGANMSKKDRDETV